MFTYPVAKWTGGIFFEHVHRLIASVIGMIMIVVAVWTWVVDDRRWLKRLTAGALLAVIVQGILGGMTVLMQLPPAVSIGHALLAQSFLLMTVAIAAATSRAWITGDAAVAVPVDARVRTLLAASVVVTFLQILLGALVRHTYSAPAIPDFPLSNGALIPAFTDFHVVIHFAHRVGAVVTSALIITGGVLVLRSGTLPRLRMPAIAMMLAVLVQVLLGATVIWTRQAILPNTLHVAFGAVTFATVFLAYLRAARWYQFRETRLASALRVQEAGA